MKVAHDVYAETNPSFCATTLVEFTKAYSSTQSEGPEMPVAFLALPIALSGELAVTFDGTNKKTGLLEWLDRSPQVQIGIAERINASLDIVTDAIRFGCFTRVLIIGDGARLKVGGTNLKAGAPSTLKGEPGHVIKRAERLGYWFATAGSTRSVFSMMGLTV